MGFNSGFKGLRACRKRVLKRGSNKIAEKVA